MKMDKKIGDNLKLSKKILVTKKKINKQTNLSYFVELNSWSEIPDYARKSGSTRKIREMMCEEPT
jgi:hypothetical protein